MNPPKTNGSATKPIKGLSTRMKPKIMTKIPAPKVKIAGDLPFLASRAQAAVYRKLGRKVPVEPQSVEMAQYFWYFDAGKAARELGFSPRDPADTLRDTVKYIREQLLGNGALSRERVPALAGGAG